MKKIAVILSLIILFGHTCLGQGKIANIGFDQLIVNSKSLQLFESVIKLVVEKKIIENILENNLKDGIKKPSLVELNSIQFFDFILNSLQVNVNNTVQHPAENKQENQPSKLMKYIKEHLFILIGFGVTWLVMFLLFFISRKKGHKINMSERELIISAVMGSERIEKKFLSKSSINNDNYTSRTIYQLEKKIAYIEKQLYQLHNKNISKIENEYNDRLAIKSPSDIFDRFYKSKNGKILIEELHNSTDALFRVFNIKGNDAKFEYCGGVINQDFFTDICSFSNNPSDIPNKTRITTSIPGTVIKDSNNNWEVVEKAKIKFE
jgi:hypothetical protein